MLHVRRFLTRSPASSQLMASFSSSASSSSSLSSSASSSCSVGFIGTGVMGRYMAEHLMVKGRYESMYVYNRTASKAQPLVDKGAVLCESPRAVAEQSDVVFSIVGFPSDVEQVVLCEDTGVLAGLHPCAGQGDLLQGTSQRHRLHRCACLRRGRRREERDFINHGWG
jgi:hypothetical protein